MKSGTVIANEASVYFSEVKRVIKGYFIIVNKNVTNPVR